MMDVLCTHYHNDHSANNGKIASAGSRIFYHHALEKKINYQRTKDKAWVPKKTSGRAA